MGVCSERIMTWHAGLGNGAGRILSGLDMDRESIAVVAAA
jgi:hypothetical protein